MGGARVTQDEVNQIVTMKVIDPLVTEHHVAQVVGRHHETVKRIVEDQKALIDGYRALKQADIIEELDIFRRAHLVNLAGPDKIEACSALQSATVYGILTDKLLLESGRPTSITLSATVDTTMPDLLSRLQRTLERRAGHTSSSNDGSDQPIEATLVNDGPSK